jgi:MFS family permease
LTALLAQIPGGVLADSVRWKRGLAAIGVVMIAVAALILAVRPTMAFVYSAEVLHGVTAGIAGSSIAAISLGLAGMRGISARVGRNLRYAAAGNAITAILMGVLGAYWDGRAIFFAAALLCTPALFGLWLIRPEEVDYIRARNASKRARSFTLHRVLDVVRNRQLLIFAACMVLFHFSNASLLPLVGQNLGAGKSDGGAMLMGVLIAGPQVVVALLAPWIGYWSEHWGRKPILLLGFGCEALRALLFATSNNPVLIGIGQLLDGITGASMLLMTTLVIADLTAGSGRFNLTLGVVGTATGLAAASSTAVMGSVVQHLGDTVGFLILAAGTVAGLAALALALSESKPPKYQD